MGYTSINGRQVPVYEAVCLKEIPEPCTSCTQYGNPIDAVSNTKVAREIDYASADGAVQLHRTYSSVKGRWSWGHSTSLADLTGRTTSRPEASTLISNVNLVPAGIYSGNAPPAKPTPRSFPIVKSQWSDGPKEAWLFSPTGSTLFTEATSGTFSTVALSKPQLLLTNDGSGGTQWQHRRSDYGFDIFDGEGRLVRQVSYGGRVVEFRRAGDWLAIVSVPSGRQIVLSNVYGPSPGGNFDTATLPDGRQLRYEFEDNALVKSVSYADGTKKQYLYDEAGLSGTTDSVGRLTGVFDESGKRHATYTYDSAGPKTTELAGGVNKYSFSFWASYTQVASPPLDKITNVYWDRGPDGERRLTQRLIPEGSGSASASTRLAYDASGNRTSEDDYRGNRTCFAYDTSNRETTRVAGLSSGAACNGYLQVNSTLVPGARKTTTEWHPDWRLKAKVAEPGRITTYIYNGQPDPFNGGVVASCAPASALLPDGKPIAVLCKQVEQATTDTDGSKGFSAVLQAGVPSRTQQWTYNEHGQVLTATDPRGNATTYAYYPDTTADHTRGDLQSVTTANGLVTQYTKYNPHGQVLQMVDPNGVTTDHTYDLRQRLTSVSTAGQTITYDYWPTGLLKKVTLPDGSHVRYDYDDAHRLTDVTDHLGNSVHYTLDNAGNRINEQAKDATGALSRGLSRVMDALSRVQQTTGRE